MVEKQTYQHLEQFHLILLYAHQIVYGVIVLTMFVHVMLDTQGQIVQYTHLPIVRIKLEQICKEFLIGTLSILLLTYIDKVANGYIS